MCVCVCVSVCVRAVEYLTCGACLLSTRGGIQVLVPLSIALFGDVVCPVSVLAFIFSRCWCC